MSLGYAERLSYRADLGGQLGAPEVFDAPQDVEAKAKRLAELVRNARHVVAFTGAGISTSCGIPDFRGPCGQPLPRPKVSFTHAKPSLTHQVLVALMQANKLQFLVSQNVDGLHIRSGVARDRLAELHGNCFAERCHACGAEYVRDFEVETVGFKRTSRKCSQPGCGAQLRDHILDWEDALPEDELELSEKHAREADLAICLGTSLQITPACNLPLKATRTYKGGEKQQPGQLVVINLQRTQHDKRAIKSGGLVIHARCDEVMSILARELRLAVPQYCRRDAVVIGHVQHSSSGNVSASSALAVPFSVFVQSSHGSRCPTPIVEAVTFTFEDPQLQPALLTVQPFVVRRTARREGLVRVCVTLHLHQAADEDSVQLSYTAQLQAALAPSASRREELHEFVTQVVDYSALGTVGADVAELTVAPTAAGAAAEPAQQSKRQRVE